MPNLNGIDRERWQNSVDAAEILLMLAKAEPLLPDLPIVAGPEALALFTGLRVNRVMCRLTLRRGQELGVLPATLEVRLKKLHCERCPRPMVIFPDPA